MPKYKEEKIIRITITIDKELKKKIEKLVELGVFNSVSGALRETMASFLEALEFLVQILLEAKEKGIDLSDMNNWVKIMEIAIPKLQNSMATYRLIQKTLLRIEEKKIDPGEIAKVLVS